MTWQVAKLPALGWELLNLRCLSDVKAEKFAAQMDLHECCLDHTTELGDTHTQRDTTAP